MTRSIADLFDELADRPQCAHGLNGPCAVCGLPPHNVTLEGDLLEAAEAEVSVWCFGCGEEHKPPMCAGDWP